MLLLAITLSASSCLPQTHAVAARTFVHPGLLHDRADLARMRSCVSAGLEPWKSGFDALRNDRCSRADWKLCGPCATVTRSPASAAGNFEMVMDGNAAYQNALMWCITGDEAHAKKAVEILDAWSARLTAMDGKDVQLSAGLNGFKFVNAAELLRHTYPGWSPAGVARSEKLFREVVLPPVYSFALHANGNWDAACIKTVMAIGVYCNDGALFDRAVRYFRFGKGNGRLTNYVFSESGQCQESGRDQQHTQLGLGLLAEACEIAWKQGTDLYGEAGNRLLKGFEYTARYNTGDDGVPFEGHTDTTGKYTHKKISSAGRGKLRPIYEMALNHYQNRCGTAAPYTSRAAAQIRPEAAGHGSDHPGFGTLLFSLPPDPAGGDSPRRPVPETALTQPCVRP